MADKPEQSHKPIRSQFADDPEMADLVEMFVSEIPARLDALQAAWNAGQVEAVARMAHQLGGASAGYGFPALGQAARELERRLTKMEDQAIDQLEELRREYEALIRVCARACLDEPQA
jgi:histidine phosphotransfer protein HptB